MKNLTRALLLIAAGCFLLVVLTLTALFMKKVWLGDGPLRKGHIAVLEISGMILDATAKIRELQDLLETPGLRALILRLNSPGGFVAPSQELFEAIKKADLQIPVFVSMGQVAASGGYYIALGGRKIYANPGTLTASIGVIMEFANTEKLYKWAKVELYSMKSGKFKDMGTAARAMTDEERRLIQELIMNIHGQFKAAIKERRGLEDNDIEKVADGRVMTGNQAKEAKLVDEIGSLDDVVRMAKQATGLPETGFIRYPESKRGFIRRLLFGEEAVENYGAQNFLQSLAQQAELLPRWRVMLVSPVQ